MSRGDLERLSKDELIELVLKLQRPAKTSRTSSRPPSTTAGSRASSPAPVGAQPGHEGYSRVVAEDPDTVVDHPVTACPGCGLALSPDLPAETISLHEQIELPEVVPFVEQHRRLAVVCPGCRARVVAPRPVSAASTHRVVRCEEAVVHHAAPTRGACVVHEIVDGHRPAVWLTDRCSAQQGHSDRQQKGTHPDLSGWDPRAWPTWPATSPTRSTAATTPSPGTNIWTS